MSSERSIGSAASAAGVVVGVSLAGALGGAAWTLASGADMAMWVTARASGVAAYVLLTLSVLAGLVLSSPARARMRWPSAPQRIRLHVSLTVFTLLFIALHVVVLALDPWAKVGWMGALLPWGSEYRPLPVALGVLSMWVFLLVALSASLAGRVTGRLWLVLHRFAGVAWLLAWAHGVFAGSDTPALIALYAGSGVAVLATGTWRYAARSPADRRDQLLAATSRHLTTAGRTR
ncbi:MAG: ferric reductase [bacterium]